MGPAERTELLTQRSVSVGLHGLVALGGAVLPDQLARPPLGDPEHPLEVLDGAAPAGRAHQFLYHFKAARRPATAPQANEDTVTSDSDPAFQFDVALSFAGENREYVSNIANQLRARGIRVFYDQYEQATLWGKDLYEHLDDVYQREARYCVLFASEQYARKVWTTHERKSAQARALREKEEYILPVRFDNTEIPGLRPTIGYIDTRSVTSDELIDLIIQKVHRPFTQAASPVTAPVQIPRTPEQRRELVTRRPVVWEYLLFAGILAEGKDALEPKWRDHQLRYVPKAGPLLGDAEVPSFIPKAMHELLLFSQNMDRILRTQVKEGVFGEHEVPGDPVRIEYLGQRVLEVYEGLLDWSTRIRGILITDSFKRLFELLASYADNPIAQTRAFIDEYVDEVSRLPDSLADPDRLANPNRKPIHITLRPTWDWDERLSSEFDHEMDRLRRQGLLG
jgi:hypothetical protein